MSCRELVELVTDYFDGALSEDDARRFDEHVDQCLWCSRYIEQMRVTIRTVGRIEEESISPEARRVLLAEFSQWSGGGSPARER